MRLCKIFLLCLFIPIVLLSYSCAQVISDKPDVTTHSDIISSSVRKSIVRIVGGTFSFLGEGTGFFIDKDRIVTNIHTVSHPGLFYAKLVDSEIVWAIESVTAFDIKNDLVVLKISGEGIPLPLGDSDSVQISESISAFGFPDGKYNEVKGTIHSIRRKDKWLRITVHVSPGISGGPILNSKGEVIGMCAASFYSYGYAIPSNTVKALPTANKTETLSQWHQRKVIRADYYYKLAQMKFFEKKYNETIAHLDNAIQLNPKDSVNYYSRGYVRLTLGDHEGAIADFNRAIELNPEFADAYSNRGKAKKPLDYMKQRKKTLKRQKRYTQMPENKTYWIN